MRICQLNLNKEIVFDYWLSVVEFSQLLIRLLCASAGKIDTLTNCITTKTSFWKISERWLYQVEIPKECVFDTRAGFNASWK